MANFNRGINNRNLYLITNNNRKDVIDIFLDKLLSADGVSFNWIGNAGWLICHDRHLISIDLHLSSKRLWMPPFNLQELAPHLDYAISTHDHGDHFDSESSKFLVDNGPCKLILPRSCVNDAASAGIPESKIIYVVPGQSYAPNPWMNFETIRALHGHPGRSIYIKANFDDCGYLITLGGKRIFHPGDTVLMQEHLEQLNDIDLLFVSPTEHNMHIEGCLSFIEAVDPRHIYAQHFDTYIVTDRNAYWTTGYQEPLRMALSSKHRSRYTIPESGVIYNIL